MISEYERMEQFVHDNGILLLTDSLPNEMSGYYYLNTEYGLKTITMNSNLDTTAKRIGVLAEELEHYLITPVDLFTAPKYLRDKYESAARLNAVKRLMPFERLIDVSRRSICDIYELADYLGVTLEFFESGLIAYKEYYGYSASYKDYIIYFDPFRVAKAG